MTSMQSFLVKSLLVSFMFFSLPSLAADLEAQMHSLDKAMNNIERDISDLEQSLLFPPVTRTKVFLSVANDADFKLRSVTLRIDNRQQSYHVYSEAELDALSLGGIQSLWEGNVALGERTIIAVFEGTNRKGEKLSGEAKLNFEKTLEGRALELQVLGGKQIDFQIKDWGAN